MKIDPSRNPTYLHVVGFGEYTGQKASLRVINVTPAFTITEQSLFFNILPNTGVKSERGNVTPLIYWRNEDGFRRWPLFKESNGYTKPSGFKVSTISYSEPQPPQS